MLRNHGIYLTCHSLWFGATILLACLAAQQPRAFSLQLRYCVIAAAVLTLVVAFVQATLGILLDLVFSGPPDVAAYGVSFALFCAAWLPLALVWSIPGAGARPAGLLIQITTTVVTAATAVPLWRIGGWALLASAGLLVGAWSGLRWAGVLQPRGASRAATPDQAAKPQPRF